MLDELKAELQARADANLLRKRRLLTSAQTVNAELDGEWLLSFASNDYLGLANHPEVISALQHGAETAGAGGGASHLINGHHAYHHQLEQALARLVALPKTMLFSTGYMANLGVITALLGRDDAIFADKLNHASLNDAAVLSRASLHRYAHHDLRALERFLANSEAKRKLVVVDAVFSMDGDLAPVPDLLALCERYDAYLYLDDAHGFGVLGAQGQGVLSHFNVQSERIIYMATLGKAAGVSGAVVGGCEVVMDYLLQHARTYIYTTASPPAIAAALIKSVDIIAQDTARRAHLTHLIRTFKQKFRSKRWQLMASDTAIQPIVIGCNDEVLKLSEYLLTQGFFVPAIRPPTVPQGSARLRVSLSAAHTEQDLERLILAIERAENALS